MALQSDGKIVMAGSTDQPGTDHFALARFNTDGSLDASFDTDGKVTANFASSGDQAYGVVIQTDGKIVVAGYQFGSILPDFAIMRFNANGSLDASFGVGGKTGTGFGGDDIGQAVAIQSDGKIVMVGYTNAFGPNQIALWRLNANGSLDASFDGDGRVTTAIGANHAFGLAVALQPDGKIVVAGLAITGPTENDFVVVRYNSNGSLDTGFGLGGIVITSFGVVDGAAAIALQNDGKIVVAGIAGIGAGAFAVARYEGATIAPPATTLPVPISPNYYACVPAPSGTVVSTTPAAAQPLAVTYPVLMSVRVILETAAFAGPVDVIVAATLPNGQVYERGPTGWFPYPPATVLRAGSSAALSMTSATDNLYAGPVSSLAPGGYVGEVWVVPAGTDLTTFNIVTSPYYRWCYTKTFP